VVDTDLLELAVDGVGAARRPSAGRTPPAVNAGATARMTRFAAS
jgi:hypothetical protein